MKNYKITNILVPVSRSSELELTLAQANFFHLIYGAKFTLFMVLRKQSVFSSFIGDKKTEQLRSQEAIAQLTMRIGEFYNGDLPDFITTKVAVGNFNTHIKKELKTENYNFMLLREFGEVRNLLDGLQDLSHNLIKRIDCPVMILHDKWTDKGINEILVPLDITHKCKNTILWALQKAKVFNAKINFVSVIKPFINVSSSLTKQRAQLVKDWIESFGLDCSVTILKAETEKMDEKLISYVNESKADLVMILNHKRYFAANNHWGSFAKNLIHNSSKPVISMSVHNQPMFKIVDGFNRYSTRRTEALNVKTWELRELLGKKVKPNNII